MFGGKGVGKIEKKDFEQRLSELEERQTALEQQFKDGFEEMATILKNRQPIFNEGQPVEKMTEKEFNHLIQKYKGSPPRTVL